jgi:hypothetical protein
MPRLNRRALNNWPLGRRPLFSPKPKRKPKQQKNTKHKLCEQDAIVIAHAIAIIRAILIVYATAMAFWKNRDHMEIINDFEQKPRDYRDYRHWLVVASAKETYE